MLLDAFPLIRRYGAITALMIGFCCAALLAYQDHLHAWSVAPHVTLVKLFIFYASLLTVPWTLFFVYRLIYRSSLVDLSCVILGVFGIYSRLLEPNLTAIYHTDITLDQAASALLLSGHTHGGQIHLPWITQSMLNRISVGGYQRGLYQTQPHRQLFVTSGIGMIGLPFRFAMPPAIDILHVHYTPNT